ncbi:hypothetical protein QVD17_00159 [Tagetes erecta]|uniref:Uncharacterized protein n=1 Tax=Tagetes erecta TaxID=13708 RepID=A0AAD8P6R2_TARER|nr:hypothetical protein QVD17_00159 [Tagetes erecta]
MLLYILSGTQLYECVSFSMTIVCLNIFCFYFDPGKCNDSKGMKMVKRLDNEQNWSEVIEVDSSDEEEKNLFKDSTNSSNKKKSPLKIPRVSFQKQTRPHLV